MRKQHTIENPKAVKKRYLGDGAVSTAARGAIAFKVGRNILVEHDAVAARSAGTISLLVGGSILGEDDTVSARARGTIALSVGGDVSGLASGEGIHLKNE